MTEQTIKVGDVVAWDAVPSGALVLCSTTSGGRAYLLVSPAHVCAVKYSNAPWLAPLRALLMTNHGGLRQAWDLMLADQRVTIVALDVPADATAEDLRGLAEVFEVREALLKFNLSTLAGVLGLELTVYLVGNLLAVFRNIDAAAELLYRAGWRPGMTAEDAARLLGDQ